MFLHREPKRLHLNFQFTILLQLLTCDLHCVPQGCVWSFKMTILQQFFDLSVWRCKIAIFAPVLLFDFISLRRAEKRKGDMRWDEMRGDKMRWDEVEKLRRRDMRWDETRLDKYIYIYVNWDKKSSDEFRWDGSNERRRDGTWKEMSEEWAVKTFFLQSTECPFFCPQPIAYLAVIGLFVSKLPPPVCPDTTCIWEGSDIVLLPLRRLCLWLLQVSSEQYVTMCGP